MKVVCCGLIIVKGLVPPQIQKGFYVWGESTERLECRRKMPDRLHSPRAADFYNERPNLCGVLWRREVKGMMRTNSKLITQRKRERKQNADHKET